MLPEVAQLLELLRSAPGQQRERLLAGVADWPRLIANATEWRMVLPLQNVVESSTLSLPSHVTDTLTDLGTQRALQALRQTRQLGEVLRTLSEAGVPALSYKGPTLAYLAFGHLGARESSDLDLLVHPQDYHRAAEALLADGFHHDYPPPTRCQLKQAYEVCLIHSQRRVAVDLHRSFFAGSTNFSLSLAHHQPHSVFLMGNSIPTLAPMELLLLLGVHGSKHCWREMRWIHDLHGLLDRQTFHWDEVLARAAAEGAVRALSIGLTLAHELFGSALPEQFLPDGLTRLLVDESKSYLGRRGPGLRQQHLYHWRMADTLAQRFRYLLWTIFCPHELDLAFVDLPEALWPAYYLIRPYRVIKQRYFEKARISR